MRNFRKVLIKLFLVIILVTIGFYTKAYEGFGQEFVTNSFGGVIYVVFFIILASIIFPRTNPLLITLIVLGITCILEFSQLIQTDLLNRLREYFVIRSLIGSVFNVFDFLYYFIGAFIGFGVILTLNRKRIIEE